MKKYIIMWSAFLFIEVAYSQDYLSTSSYYMNAFSINPAFSGVGDELFLTFQANKYTGSQSGKGIDYISFGGYYNLGAGLASGLRLNSQQLGNVDYSSLDISLSYKAQLNKDHFLSFTLAPGLYREQFVQNTSDYSQWVDRGDQLLFGEGGSTFDRTLVTVGAGILYNFKGLQVSAYLPYLLRGKESFSSNFTAYAKYVYNEAQDRAQVKFGNYALFKYQPDASYIYDVGTLVGFQDAVWVNLAYRSNQSAAVGMVFIIPDMQVGYNFNYSFGDFQDLIHTKHELTLVFVTNKLMKFRTRKLW